MIPLNHVERKNAFVKFLLSGLLLLAVFGYGIFSYSFVHDDIKTNISAENSEIVRMMNFIDDADKLVEALDNADSQVEKNKFSVELNHLIVGEKSSYISTETLFSRIEDNYRNLIKSKEVIGNKYKEQIEDLEKQVEKLEEGQEDDGKDLRMVKSGLERIASDLADIGNDFSGRDWCKGFGRGGRDSYKNELKDKLSMMKNEILKQASSL